MTDGLFVREAGAGLPVVLVHAGVADGRMWEPQVEFLEDRYRVIVPDLRGFGHSPIPGHPYSDAADLATLASELGIERAAWVGCSQGGTTVLDLALAAPGLVAAIVLVDCVPSGYPVTDPATWAGWAAAEEAYDAGDLRRAAEIEMEMWLVGPTRGAQDVSAEPRQLVIAMLLDSYGHGQGEEIDPGQPALDHLETVTAPALVVAGAHDRTDFRKAAEVMAGRMPTASLHVIADAAHLPSLERPTAFNQLLTGFLTEEYQ